MTKNKNFKMVIAYDGTDYCGWQVQPDKKTVCGVLEKTFARVFGRAIKITGASRTDGGVHALGQVARFSTDLAIDPVILHKSFNAQLPRDILVRSLTDVSNWSFVDSAKIIRPFHPMYNIEKKIYWYHIFTRRPLPMYQRYGLHFPMKFDAQKLYDALHVFVGKYDFRSFCTGNDHNSTVRTVQAISCEYLRAYQAYRIAVVGPGFLRYMIRRMVGAALQVAATPAMGTGDIVRALQEKNPVQQFRTAPAHGLMLRKIVYKNFDT